MGEPVATTAPTAPAHGMTMIRCWCGACDRPQVWAVPTGTTAATVENEVTCYDCNGQLRGGQAA